MAQEFNISNLEKFGIIYRITNKINKKIYIGQTIQGIKKRWWQHRYEAKKDKQLLLISRAIKKYNESNFIIEEIDKCDSQEELNYFETYWIDYFDATNKKIGYNIKYGGGRNQISDYERLKRAKFFIKCIETEEIFISYKSAANYKGISAGNISSCISNRKSYLSLNGCRWERINKNEVKDLSKVIICDKPSKKAEKTNIKKIECIETREIYPSISFLSKKINIGKTVLLRIINENIKWNNLSYKYINNKKFNTNHARKIYCIETNEIWDSVDKLAASLEMEKFTYLRKKINNGELFRGKIYSYIN